MRTTQKEIPEDVLLKPGDYTVDLTNRGNPDFGQDPTRSMYGVPERTTRVSSMREASLVCREYIDEHGLGGGNWTGGQIMENGKIVAYVSYNGRVWKPEMSS